MLIQCEAFLGTAWTQRPERRAYQEGERAKKMENPTLCGPLEANSKRYAALAEKLEAARKGLTAR